MPWGCMIAGTMTLSHTAGTRRSTPRAVPSTCRLVKSRAQPQAATSSSSAQGRARRNRRGDRRENDAGIITGIRSQGVILAPGANLKLGRRLGLGRAASCASATSYGAVDSANPDTLAESWNGSP